MADTDNPYDKVYDNLFKAPAADMTQRDPLTPAPPPAPVPDDMGTPGAPSPELTDPTGPPESSLRDAVKQGMQYNPDQAAKALPVAQQNQIPLDMAMRAPTLQRDLDFDHIDFKTLNEQYPKLADFFRNPENAAVAHDSIDSLTRLQDMGNAFWYSAWGGVANVIGYGADVLKHVPALPGTDNSDVIKMLNGVQETTDQAAWYANYMQPQGAHETIGTETAGFLGQVVPATAASVYSPPAGAMMWAGMFARPMQVAAREHGASEEMQTAVGAAAALTSTLAVTPALKMLSNKSPLIAEMIAKVPDLVKQGWLQDIARQPWAQQAMQMGGKAAVGAEMNVTQTLLNNLIEHYTFNPDKDVLDGLKKQSEIGGVAGGVMHMLLSRIAGHGLPTPERPPLPPQDVAENLQEQGRQVAQSPLWTRSPDTFNALQRKLWGDKTLYIPVEEGRKFFQGQDDKTQETIAGKIPDLATRAAEADATGSDIPVAYADYLTWLAPHDKGGILAKSAKMDAAHEPIDVAALYPELLDMVPKEEEEDESAKALETRWVREAVQGGLSQHEAETWAHSMREAYTTLTARGAEARSAFENLTVAPHNPAEKLSDAGLDYTIAKMKQRIGARQKAAEAKAEKEAEAPKQGDLVGGKPKKERVKGGPTPIINYLADNGKILRGSTAAKELEHMGVTGDTHPRLFSTKGKLPDVDNLVQVELNNHLDMHGIPAHAPDDGYGYVDPAWIYDQIREEAHGGGMVTAADKAKDEHNEYLDRFEGYLHSLGLEPDKATKAEIKSAVAKSRAVGETRYQFSGEKALTSNLKALSDAKKMLSDGKDMEAVRKETGWFKWVDGKWRFEISDKDARLKGLSSKEMGGYGNSESYGKLEDVLDHPALFNAYPQLRDIKVDIDIYYNIARDGSYQSAREINGTNYEPEIRVRAPSMDTAKSVLLHEIQHAIQDIEGHANGGAARTYLDAMTKESAEAWGKIRDINEKLKTAEGKEYQKLIDEKMELVPIANRDVSDMHKESYKKYHQLAGEVEARNTQERHDFSDEDRKAVSIQETQDTHDKDAKVIFDNGLQFDAPETITREQPGKRGSITFTPDARSIINLFSNRDKSTILHESGHFFLNVLRNSDSPGLRALWDKTRAWWGENHGDVYDEAKRYNPYQVRQHELDYHAVEMNGQEVGAFDSKKAADEFAEKAHQQLLDDLEERGGKDYVKRFLESDMAAPDDVDQMILTAMDEQFARAHEAYLMEGKAPSEGMRGVFRRFTAWLAKIYGSAQKLNVTMSPEIRDVFDRIYASDEAIESAKHLQAFKPDTGIMEMMTAPQREAYLKQQQAREDQAREATVRKALRDADKQTKDWWRTESEAREKALTEQYLRQPDYAAADRLQRGEDGMKLSRAAVEAKYGKDVSKAMDKRLFGDKGVDPDLVADRLGYDTGDDLVVALTKLDPLEKRVKDEARAEMVKEHGDVFLNGNLEEVAVRNMLSAEADGLIEKEMKAAAKGDEPMPTGKDFKRAARAAIETMPVTAALKPNRFLQAVIRNARAGAKALATKDYEGYASAKRRELFALNMYRETKDFQDKHEKALDYFNNVLRRPKRTRPTVDPTFRRAAWGVLGNFMPSRERPLNLADLHTLLSANISSEYDTPVQIPPEAATAWGKKSFKDMTVAEFNSVRDIVKGIMTYGQNKQSILLDGEKHDYREMIAKVQAIVSQESRDRVSWSRNSFQKVFDNVVSTLLQTDTYLELMDRGDKTGLMQRLIKRPLDLARSNEIARSKTVYDDLHKLFTDSYTPKELREMTGYPYKLGKLPLLESRKMMVNGRMFTREERLAYLLNSGNEGNMEAVDEGMGWKDADRQAMMATFSKKDYDFAQKVWDYVDSYWPEISALEEKRYGFSPEKVENRELDTPHGKYRGGYYPIKFDGSKNARAQEFELEKEMKGYIGYASTLTKRGHTMERVGANKLDRMPVNLSFGVLTSHLQNVLHDLEMGPAIQQVGKIIRDTRFKSPFIDRFGSDAYGAVDLWIKDIASGHVRSGSWPAMIDTWARRNAQVATMALNTTTIMSHPGRLMNSVEGLGGGTEGMKWLGHGFREQFLAMRSPTEYKALLAKIGNASGLMKSRVDTLSREMAEAKQHYSSDPLDTHAYRRALLAPIALMQVHAVDISTWLGAYHQALDRAGPLQEGTPAEVGKREREAVFAADQVVRKYQGSGLMEDMSGLLRGTLSSDTRQSALVKTLTFAHSFFNNKFNRLYLATKQADLASAAGRYKYARSIVTISLMDALITDLLLKRLPGMLGEDDDKKKIAEGWGWWMANRGLELIPLARDAERWAEGQPSGSPAEDVAKSVGDMVGALHKDKEDKKELQAIISGVGMGTGLLPSVEMNRLIDLINRLNDGKPVGYQDFVRTRRKAEK